MPRSLCYILGNDFYTLFGNILKSESYIEFRKPLVRKQGKLFKYPPCTGTDEQIEGTRRRLHGKNVSRKVKWKAEMRNPRIMRNE